MVFVLATKVLRFKNLTKDKSDGIAMDLNKKGVALFFPVSNRRVKIESWK